MTAIYLQIIFSVIAIVYAVAIVIVTKSTYGMMRKRGVEEMVAVYYNRKIVHMAAVVASFVERFEIGPIDDNVLITVATVIVLVVGIVIT